MSRHLPVFPVSTAKQDDLRRRMAALGLTEADFGESYFKTVVSGGKAGLIGVMLFHPASGIRVRCRRERSQGINRFIARRMLVEELEARLRKASAPPVALPTEPPHISLPPPPAHWGMNLESDPEAFS